MPWDPTHYLQYADERGRPFVELLARVRAEPRSIVDLGCGPGNLTALLRERWPSADVLGLDSSPQMISRAEAEVRDVGFELADVREPLPRGRHDLIVSNATLQWVPGHLGLLPSLLDALPTGGVLAFSVPGNFDEPSHTLRRDLAARAPYDAHVAGVTVPAAHDAATYLHALAEQGAQVDAWETTYLHVLRGDDAVFAWVSATGARPTIEALPVDLRARFEREFKAALREAYPQVEVGGEPGVVLPFRRVFAVAQRV